MHEHVLLHPAPSSDPAAQALPGFAPGAVAPAEEDAAEERLTAVQQDIKALDEVRISAFRQPLAGEDPGWLARAQADLKRMHPELLMEKKEADKW